MFRLYYVLILLSISATQILLGTAIEIKTMADYKALCAQDKPVVLMFYAPWCGACTSMKEPYNEVSTGSKDVILAKVSIDNAETKSLKDAFCVTAVPTFITRQTGTMSKEALSNMVKGHSRQPLTPKAPAKEVPSNPSAKK